MVLVITVAAIRTGDADAFMVLAFLTLMPLVGMLATWKRNPLLMLFVALMLLPYGLYVSWGFGNIYRVLMGLGIGLFVMSSFLMVGLENHRSEQ